TLD
ncbi:L-fucose isomerase, partial [Haemophilus influenzae]